MEVARLRCLMPSSELSSSVSIKLMSGSVSAKVLSGVRVCTDGPHSTGNGLRVVDLELDASRRSCGKRKSGQLSLRSSGLPRDHAFSHPLVHTSLTFLPTFHAGTMNTHMRMDIGLHKRTAVRGKGLTITTLA